MTREETKTVLAMMVTAYTERLMPVINEMTINVWHQLLGDIPYKAAQAAVAGWITTNRYPPTIADIREMVVKVETDQLDTPEMEWTRLMYAVRKYGYTEPDDASRYLSGMWGMVGGDWKYYCTLPDDEQPNEKARFIRMYTTYQRREKMRLQMPESVRIALDGIGQGQGLLEEGGAGDITLPQT